MVIDPNLSVLAEQRTVNKVLTKGAEMNFGVLNGCLKLLERIVKANKNGGQVPGAAAIAQCAHTLLSKPRDKVMKDTPDPALSPITIQRHADFTYLQDRVHAFGDVKEGDIVPVQRLNIFHQTYRKDGQASNYPWTIKITNAKAPVHFQATGATTFSANAMTDKQEAFIQVSDADMYRMMSRVCHYVTVWETSVAAEIVKQGRAARDAERSRYNQQQATQAAPAPAPAASQPNTMPPAAAPPRTTGKSQSVTTYGLV